MKKSLKMVMIDNYDSFTYNLVQYFQQLGVDVTTVRNDAKTAAEHLQAPPDFFVISPGPATPNEAGCSLDLIKGAHQAKVPLLGVCLGHQAIGQAFGGKVVRAALPMHGKVSPIRHRSIGVFKDLPEPLAATRYHSLIVERASLPADLEITAWTDDQTIMGLRHKASLIEGVQFHPESVLTADGLKMLGNFVNAVRSAPARP